MNLAFWMFQDRRGTCIMRRNCGYWLTSHSAHMDAFVVAIASRSLLMCVQSGGRSLCSMLSADAVAYATLSAAVLCLSTAVGCSWLIKDPEGIEVRSVHTSTSKTTTTATTTYLPQWQIFCELVIRPPLLIWTTGKSAD